MRKVSVALWRASHFGLHMMVAAFIMPLTALLLTDGTGTTYQIVKTTSSVFIAAGIPLRLFHWGVGDLVLCDWCMKAPLAMPQPAGATPAALRAAHFFAGKTRTAESLAVLAVALAYILYSGSDSVVPVAALATAGVAIAALNINKRTHSHRTLWCSHCATTQESSA